MKHSRKVTRPRRRLCIRTVRKFNEHWSILNRNKGNSERKITQITENNIAIVQRAIAEIPAFSVRHKETNLSKSKFHRIFKKNIRLHSHKIQIKHELQPWDYFGRRAFWNWLWGNNPPEEIVLEKSIWRVKLSVWAGLCRNGNVIGPLFMTKILQDNFI